MQDTMPENPRFEETPPPAIDLKTEEARDLPPHISEPAARNIDLGKVASEMTTDRRGAQMPPENQVSKIPGAPAREVSYLKATGALLLVLGLIILSGYVIKRFAPHTGLMRGTSLGEVLGRIYLNPRATLHFVRSGGRVLVIGVTPAQISLVAEFDASAFEETVSSKQEELEQPDETRKSRFAQLLSRLRSQSEEPKPEESPIITDESLHALREEIVRLQQYVKEMSRGETKV